MTKTVHIYLKKNELVSKFDFFKKTLENHTKKKISNSKVVELAFDDNWFDKFNNLKNEKRKKKRK